MWLVWYLFDIEIKFKTLDKINSNHMISQLYKSGSIYPHQGTPVMGSLIWCVKFIRVFQNWSRMPFRSTETPIYTTSILDHEIWTQLHIDTQNTKYKVFVWSITSKLWNWISQHNKNQTGSFHLPRMIRNNTRLFRFKSRLQDHLESYNPSNSKWS